MYKCNCIKARIQKEDVKAFNERMPAKMQKALSGAILQDQAVVRGEFLGTNQSGSLRLEGNSHCLRRLISTSGRGALAFDRAIGGVRWVEVLATLQTSFDTSRMVNESKRRKLFNH